MITHRSFTGLLMLVLYTTNSDGLMLESTCTTIKDQLWRVDLTISSAAEQFYTGPFYKSYAVDNRLRFLLNNYTATISEYNQHLAQITTFVKRKLKQFSIATHGLEENTTLLDKIFQHVEERNAFHRLQLKEQQEVNRILSEETEELRKTFTNMEQQKLQLEQRVANGTEMLASMVTETRKLQAKINDNPVHVQS
uniref:Secreted protein n=1 Tax=Anopheles farauti TaxID=69004 RepID=A0A182QGY3_9DIPT